MIMQGGMDETIVTTTVIVNIIIVIASSNQIFHDDDINHDGSEITFLFVPIIGVSAEAFVVDNDSSSLLLVFLFTTVSSLWI